MSQPPAPHQPPAPPSPYTTHPADPKDAPAARRSRETVDKLRGLSARLEDLHFRVAHSLGADDLAALQSAVGELKAMAGEPEDPEEHAKKK
jgi:hypothetical protein